MKIFKYINLLSLIILNGCFNPAKDCEKEKHKESIKLSIKQIDSLSDIIKESSLKNDIAKIDEIYNNYLKPNWKDTNNVDFLLQRAYASLMKFKFQDAFIDVARAKKINNKDAHIYYINGLAFGMSSPNLDSCIFYFNKAINIEPNNVIYIQSRAEAYNSIQEYNKAIEDINKAISIDSTNIKLVHLRAGYLYNNKNYESTIKDLTKCISYKKQDDLFYFRGNCYYFLEKYSLAIEDYNIAIQMNTNIGAYYTARGTAKFKLKDRDAAFEDLKKAKDLGDPEGIQYYNDCLEWYSKHKKI